MLLWLRRRPFLRAGELFFGYFIWYSIGRFFIEGIRTDSLDFTGPAWLASFINALWSPMKIVFEPGVMTYGGNVRFSQLLALLIVIGMAIVIIVRRKKGYASVRYADPIESSKAFRQKQSEKMKSSRIKEPTMIRTVLFDLDGTIVDTNELIVQSFLHSLEGETAEPVGRELIIPNMGRPLVEQMEFFTGKKEVEEIIKKYRTFNLSKHDELVREFPNVRVVMAEAACKRD